MPREEDVRGHLRNVVDRAFIDLWQPLTDHDDCPIGVFGEIYLGLSQHLREPDHEYLKGDDGTVRDASVRLADRVLQALGDSAKAEGLLASLSDQDFDSEAVAATAISGVFDVLEDVASDDMATAYALHLRLFVDRYSLRYYVGDRGRLWVTFPGLASTLFDELRRAADASPHLLQELNDFERALADCVADPLESKIKTAIQKEINVLEALAGGHSLVHGNTLGRMYDEVDSWPHASVSDAAKSLYKFACDYPGIRHAGTFDAASRPLDFRDLAGVTVLLVGVSAYLSEGLEGTVRDIVGDALEVRGSASGSFAPWLSDSHREIAP